MHGAREGETTPTSLPVSLSLLLINFSHYFIVFWWSQLHEVLLSAAKCLVFVSLFYFIVFRWRLKLAGQLGRLSATNKLVFVCLFTRQTQFEPNFVLCLFRRFN